MVALDGVSAEQLVTLEGCELSVAFSASTSQAIAIGRQLAQVLKMAGIKNRTAHQEHYLNGIGHFF